MKTATGLRWKLRCHGYGVRKTGRMFRDGYGLLDFDQKISKWTVYRDEEEVGYYIREKPFGKLALVCTTSDQDVAIHLKQVAQFHVSVAY
jgi:hypothetical protein